MPTTSAMRWSSRTGPADHRHQLFGRGHRLAVLEVRLQVGDGEPPHGADGLQVAGQLARSAAAAEGRGQCRDVQGRLDPERRRDHPVHRLSAPLPVHGGRAAPAHREPAGHRRPLQGRGLGPQPGRCSTSACRTSGTPSTCSMPRPGMCATSSWGASRCPARRRWWPTSKRASRRRMRWRMIMPAISYQGDYVRELIAETDYPSFDVAAADEAFFQWKKHKKQDIMAFRDNAYVSPMTGTMAPKHHTPWVEALDDSLESLSAGACLTGQNCQPPARARRVGTNKVAPNPIGSGHASSWQRRACPGPDPGQTFGQANRGWSRRRLRLPRSGRRCPGRRRCTWWPARGARCGP
jgi:hypothetical protein